MAGMLDESLDSNINFKDDEFIVKSYWEKIWILSAGVLMNILLAFIIFASIGYYQGKSEVLNEPIISELREEMPAQTAGMLAGDEIKSINGKDIYTWDDLTTIIHSLPNEEISLVVQTFFFGISESVAFLVLEIALAASFLTSFSSFLVSLL